ncbi:MAG: adhesin, partial [Planctomycetaceae bacterium]|nr:adhesin [Planctomycetaceae bacterium]
QTNATATGLSAGTYTVTVTDVQGCTDSDNATVTEPATALSVTAAESKKVTCNGGSDGEATATPTGGWAGYSYLWDDGQTNATATGLSAGTYTVTVTDAQGCTDSDNATVTEPATALSVTAAESKKVTCNGGSDGEATATPTGGWAGYSSSWDDGQTNATATGLSAGTYTVTVTDAQGCTD